MTLRQKQILKLIIEEYIATGQPVASSHLIDKYKLKVSPATIRSEMNKLESQKFLQKCHTSSGRIPTVEGYKYYAQVLVNNDDQLLIQKLQDILAKRRLSIDLVLDQAAKAISEIAGLTLITSSNSQDELLKSLFLTPLDQKIATIVIVTSTGRVESKLIEFSSNLSLNDIRIAIRLFKDRLIDTPLKFLSQKVDTLGPLLAKSVKNYEELIATFVGKVFNFPHHITNKVYGNSNLVKLSEIKHEDLAKLLNLIENKSIWESIEGKLPDDQTLKIAISPNNIAIISKKIALNNSTKEISIVGSNRLNYQGAKTAIKILEGFLKEG